MKKTLLKQKITLVVFSLFIFIILLEAGLRIGGFVFLSLQEYRNKISIRQKGAYRIMCLGESTTAGQWPKPLEDFLNENGYQIEEGVIFQPLLERTNFQPTTKDKLVSY